MVVDTTGPTATIVAVSPDPRNTAVSTVDVTFSEPIDLKTFTSAAVSLTRSGVAVLTGLTTSLVSGTTYRISGLGNFTTTAGTYVLKVDATKVKDLAGNAGVGTTSDTWVMDKTGPTATVVAVSPDPRSTAVFTVDVTFSEPIDLKTFTSAAVSLTRSGVAVALTGLTTSLVSGTTYRISGLGNFTTTAGTYVLKVDATKVKDLARNAGVGTTSDTWVMDKTGPTATVVAVSPDPRSTAVFTVDVTFSEPIDLKTFTSAAVSLTRSGIAVAHRADHQFGFRHYLPD